VFTDNWLFLFSTIYLVDIFIGLFCKDSILINQLTVSEI